MVFISPHHWKADGFPIGNSFLSGRVKGNRLFAGLFLNQSKQCRTKKKQLEKGLYRMYNMRV